MKRRGLTLLELLVVLTILISLSTIIVPMIGSFGRKSQVVATRENLFRLQELICNRYLADMGELPRPKLDGSGKDPLGVSRVNHPQLRYLFVNPDTEDITTIQESNRLMSQRRWQGPYVRHGGARYQQVDAKGFLANYGIGDVFEGDPPQITTRGDPAILDAWGRPIVLQEPDDGAAGTTNDKKYARLVSAGPNGIIDTPLTVLMPDDTNTATGRGDDIIVFLFRHDDYGEENPTLE